MAVCNCNGDELTSHPLPATLLDYEQFTFIYSPASIGALVCARFGRETLVISRLDWDHNAGCGIGDFFT